LSDELEAARKVLTSCMAALADAQEDANHAQQRVEAAVAPILAAEVDRLIGEAEAARASLDEKFGLLLWLRSVVPPGPAVQRITWALPAPPPPGARPHDYPTPTAWVAAREALLVDAGAALPMAWWLHHHPC
jgi:hypothetical protein